MLKTPEVLRQRLGFAVYEAPQIGAIALKIARQPMELATRSIRRVRDGADSLFGIFADPKHATNNSLLATLDLPGTETDHSAQLASGELDERSAEVKFARQLCDRTLKILSTPADQRTERENASLVHARAALQSAPALLTACKYLSADDLLRITSFAFPEPTPK